MKRKMGALIQYKLLKIKLLLITDYSHLGDYTEALVFDSESWLIFAILTDINFTAKIMKQNTDIPSARSSLWKRCWRFVKNAHLPEFFLYAIILPCFALSALSSCTGCSYNHEKAMGSIDNILGKVDTLMKKTDRFLEEHLPEEPPIDYEKEGVNRKHLFVFTDTTMTYNASRSCRE